MSSLKVKQSCFGFVSKLLYLVIRLAGAQPTAAGTGGVKSALRRDTSEGSIYGKGCGPAPVGEQLIAAC